jgi:hypothetical protein
LTGSWANSSNRANIYSSVLCAILTPYLVAPVNTFSSTSAGILEGRPGHGASSSIQYQDPQSAVATGAQKLVRRARIILMAAESNPRLDQDMENPNRSRLYGLKRLFAVIREAGAPFR